MTSQTRAAPDLYQTFAGCVGRMSAQMEHAWLLHHDPSPYETQRITFLSLLDAVLPPGAERSALAHRIDAKMAHASLLTIATFAKAQERAAKAEKRANWHLSQCANLLLDS